MAKKTTDDFVKNALLLGIGAVSLTKEKVNKLVKSVKKNYNLNEKDGRTVVNKALAESKKQAISLKGQVRKHLSMLLDELDIPTKKDLKNVGKRHKKRKR